jgi:hypothetical protein
MILAKSPREIAAYLRRLGYDAYVRKNYVKVNGDVNHDDLDPAVDETDMKVIRKATETRIIPHGVQAFA